MWTSLVACRRARILSCPEFAFLLLLCLIEKASRGRFLNEKDGINRLDDGFKVVIVPSGSMVALFFYTRSLRLEMSWLHGVASGCSFPEVCSRWILPDSSRYARESITLSQPLLQRYMVRCSEIRPRAFAETRSRLAASREGVTSLSRVAFPLWDIPLKRAFPLLYDNFSLLLPLFLFFFSSTFSTIKSISPVAKARLTKQILNFFSPSLTAL